jgi:hypothetical protein
VVCGLTGVIPCETLLSSLITLATGGLLCAGLALVVALAPRQDSGGTFVALAVAAFLGISGMIAMAMAGDRVGVHWAFLHPAGALQAELLGHAGFSRQLLTDWWNRDRFADPRYSAPLGLVPLWAALFSLVAGAFMAHGACRRLAAPHRPLLGKLQSVGLFAVVAVALIVPLSGEAGWHVAADTPPFVFGLLLLPVATLMGLLATPTGEAWTMALRHRRARPLSDDGAPHVAVWLMLAVFAALMVLQGGPSSLLASLRGDEWFALQWGCALVITLPVYLLFASARFATTGGRVAFGAAIFAHVFMQLVAVTCVAKDGAGTGMETSFVELAGLLGVLVPAWVVWRQHVLKRKLLLA